MQYLLRVSHLFVHKNRDEVFAIKEKLIIKTSAVNLSTGAADAHNLLIAGRIGNVFLNKNLYLLLRKLNINLQ